MVARGALEAGDGLRAVYSGDRRWGRDVRHRIDREVSTAALRRAWDDSPPPQFQAKWSGFLVVGASDWYTFATTSDDSSRVTIDGLVVVDNEGSRTQTGRVRLLSGTHQVTVDYGQIGGPYSITWSWAREGSTLLPVPSWALWTTAVSRWHAVAARAIDPVPFLAFTAIAAIVLWNAWQMRWFDALASLRLDWGLLLVLVFAAYFRLQYVTLPIAEAHSWRQITNADVARNFSEGSLNILYPSVSWGGSGETYVGMEFPLIQWIGGVLFRWFGDSDVICRGIAIAFSLATLVGLYGLGRCLWNAAVGRAAAFFYGISPSAIFFGRAFISDTAMVCFSVFGVWGLASYFRSGKRAPLVWGSAAAALACMVKVPAVMILAPIAYMAWESNRWSALRDRRLMSGLAVVLALTVAWYAHADVLFHRTGLGEAIWHPSGGYSPDIMAAAGPTLTVSHWSTFNQLTNPEFYSTILNRIWVMHFTPVGTIVVLLGAVLFWRARHRRMVDVWFATVVLFILVTAEGNRYHEFHQLPLLLPAALYFGLAAQAAFDTDVLRHVMPLGLGFAASAGLLMLAGVRGFEQSRVVETLFRPDRLDVRPLTLGRQLRDSTPGDSLIITVEYDRYGGNSPILLYHSRRHGWSFDGESITPQVIERLRSRYGAHYFVTMIWTQLSQRADLMAYLNRQDRLPLDHGPGDAAVFSLR